MKKIVGLSGTIPKNKYSHNAAYAKIWKDILDIDMQFGESDYTDLKVACLYMGISYSGALNLFGGADAKLWERLNRWMNYLEGGGSSIILDHEMPKLGTMLMSRLKNPRTYEKFNLDFLNKLDNFCKTIQTLTMKRMIKDHVVIGDSHSLSMAPKGIPVIRLDSKTLYGAIKDKNFIYDMIPDGVKRVTLMFGSVDIRHHIMRQENPIEAVNSLWSNYFNFTENLMNDKMVKVELATPVPVESESRKMAKTGWYKGTPFYGSRENRLEITKLVIENMRKNAPCEIIEYPKYWYDMDGKQFELEIMERPKGVHIGYPNFRCNNFGYDN